MITTIALLRGINVSGQKSIRMVDLKRLFEKAGYSQVRTYLQSGNVVFQNPTDDPTDLRSQIEKAIENEFGFQVTVLLRTPADLQRVIRGNPFINLRGLDNQFMYVTYLTEKPEPQAVQKLAVPAGSVDEFLLKDTEIYLYCPGGYGKSKLSNTYFENKLKISATTRNWKTVLALAELGKPGGEGGVP